MSFRSWTRRFVSASSVLQRKDLLGSERSADVEIHDTGAECAAGGLERSDAARNCEHDLSLTNGVSTKQD